MAKAQVSARSLALSPSNQHVIASPLKLMALPP
jgi:hypothetical protein